MSKKKTETKATKSNKGLAVILILIVVGAVLWLYYGPSIPALQPKGLNVIAADLVIEYEDGSEEHINPENALQVLTVTYSGKAISRILTFWKVTSTVEGQTGTVDYSYKVWVQAQGSSKQMHLVESTDTGKPLGQEYTIGYSSWVDAPTIEQTLGSGTYTLQFYIDLSATAKTATGTLTGQKTAYVTAQVTVSQTALTLKLVAQGIEAY